MGMGSTMGKMSIMAKKCNMCVSVVQVPGGIDKSVPNDSNEGGKKVNSRLVSLTPITT